MAEPTNITNATQTGEIAKPTLVARRQVLPIFAASVHAISIAAEEREPLDRMWQEYRQLKVALQSASLYQSEQSEANAEDALYSMADRIIATPHKHTRGILIKLLLFADLSGHDLAQADPSTRALSSLIQDLRTGA